VRQLVHGDGRACRRVVGIGKMLVPDSVHPGVVLHVDEKYAHVDDVTQRAAGVGEDRGDVAEHRPGLRTDVLLDPTVGVDGHSFVRVVRTPGGDPRDEDEIVDDAGMGVPRQRGSTVVEDDRAILLHDAVRYHTCVTGETPPAANPPSLTPAALSLSLPSLRRREHPPRARALVLVDPEGAFAATVRRPRLVACLLAAALFALVPPLSFLAAASREGRYDTVIVEEMKKSGRWDKIPPAARDRALSVIVPTTRVLLPVGAVAKRWSWIVTCAAVCFGLLRATRPAARLGVVIAASAVGAAPLFVHDTLAAIALLAAEDVRAIDATNPVLSNPAAWWWSGADGRTPFAAAMRTVDFFELWACMWMALGIERAVGGQTRVPYVVVFVLHALLGIGAVAQAAFSTVR
jgi:hypothetical protein